MLVGHLAAAFGAKTFEPRVPLGAAVAAAFGLDLLWPILLPAWPRVRPHAPRRHGLHRSIVCLLPMESQSAVRNRVVRPGHARDATSVRVMAGKRGVGKSGLESLDARLHHPSPRFAAVAWRPSGGRRTVELDRGHAPRRGKSGGIRRLALPRLHDSPRCNRTVGVGGARRSHRTRSGSLSPGRPLPPARWRWPGED